MKNRIRFMYLQGYRNAGLGNKFADYRSCEQAFESFKKFFSQVFRFSGEIAVGEYPDDFFYFQQGYQDVEIQRLAMAKARAEVDAELNEMLTEFEKGKISSAKHYTELDNIC